MQPVTLETSMPPPAGARVPGAPEELHADWLSACLRHTGALSERERVAEFAAQRIGEGHGFAGVILRLSLTYAALDGGPASAAAAPRTLIAKFAADHAPTRAMLESVQGYAREVRFYRDHATRAGIPTPRCYFAHYDRERGSFLLLLEDMAPATAVDIEAGLTVEQCRTVLSHLAVMHARFWCRPELAPFAVPAELLTTVRDRFMEALPGFETRYAKRYPELARVARGLATIFAGDEFIAEVMRPPLTLTHNDLHVNNLLLPSLDGGGRFALIDWQSVAATRHGVADVARVLSVCLSPELRRRHAHELLRGYHARLCALGVQDYGLWTLRLRLRQEMAAMVAIGVLAFQTLDFERGEGARTAELMAERIESALKDARVITLLRLFVAVFAIRRTIRRWLRSGPPAATT